MVGAGVDVGRLSPDRWDLQTLQFAKQFPLTMRAYMCVCLSFGNMTFVPAFSGWRTTPKSKSGCRAVGTKLMPAHRSGVHYGLMDVDDPSRCAATFEFFSPTTPRFSMDVTNGWTTTQKRLQEVVESVVPSSSQRRRRLLLLLLSSWFLLACFLCWLCATKRAFELNHSYYMYRRV